MKSIAYALCVAGMLVLGADMITEKETGTKFASVVDGSTPSLKLACTGTACRKKTAFGAKVYAIAQWVDVNGARQALSEWQGKSAKALHGDQRFYDALCAADVEKRLKLIFVRKVSDKQIREGFKDSLLLVYPELPKIANDFLALFQDNFKKGNSIELHCLPGGVIVAYQDDKELGRLAEDKQFAAAVWKMYFQKKLEDDHLEVVKKDLINRIEVIW